VPSDCVTATLNGYRAQFCTALFTGLAPATSYSYSVKSSEGASAVYTFTNAPARAPIFAVYADFGLGNDESLSALIADAKNGGFDYVIHAGDWAYDLDDGNSVTGNKFMASVMPYAATKPYMGTVGNHEAYGTQGGGEFANYAMRQRALAQYAGANSGSNSSFWYSFDTPLIHWIAFNGESWTMSAAQLAAQAAWVAADLAKVDRAATPWVVAFSHKSYMCVIRETAARTNPALNSDPNGLTGWTRRLGQCTTGSSLARSTCNSAVTGISTRATRRSTRGAARSSLTRPPCRPTSASTRTRSTRR